MLVLDLSWSMMALDMGSPDERQPRFHIAQKVLKDFVARRPAVAFEPSATTRGESCRDPVDRIRALAGTRLDDAFARRLGEEIGGPRGCSHVLTLAHLVVDKRLNHPFLAREPTDLLVRKNAHWVSCIIINQVMWAPWAST
jgi:hypothetical protein